MQRGMLPGTGISCAEQRDLTHPHAAGGLGGKGGFQVARRGEDRGDDVVEFCDLIRAEEFFQQFPRGRQNEFRLIRFDSDRPPNSSHGRHMLFGAVKKLVISNTRPPHVNRNPFSQQECGGRTRPRPHRDCIKRYSTTAARRRRQAWQSQCHKWHTAVAKAVAQVADFGKAGFTGSGAVFYLGIGNRREGPRVYSGGSISCGLAGII